jgi:hypothetical protein
METVKTTKTIRPAAHDCNRIDTSTKSNIPLVTTVMLGGAPPEKKRLNDVRGKNKRSRINQVIPSQKGQIRENLDITLQYYSIVSLAKNILGEAVSISTVETLIEEARSKFGVKKNQEDAMDWANGFQFPSDAGLRDKENVERKGGDIVQYIQEIHTTTKENRLNLARIEKLVPKSDPDYSALSRLVEGVPIFTNKGFTPNRGFVKDIPIRMRAKYLSMAPVINKIVYQLYEEGQALILPTSMC